MKKIAVLINENKLIFKYRTNKPVEPNLLNTNVISNNELVFSDEYIKNNIKIVGLFISDLAKEREINEIVVSNNNIGELVIDIIKRISGPLTFSIIDDVNLSYTLCESIAKAKNINHLNCYGLPQFMIETLDKYGVSVESRYEVLFTSKFMADNNLTSFSKIYYKTNIRIENILENDDINDIKTFFAINKYLKIIHFDKYSIDNIRLIVDILQSTKAKNVSLQIHDDLEGVEDISELKEINKELKRRNKIKLTLVYSKDYLEKNYLQQVIFTTLKLCAIVIFVIISAIVGYIAINNHTSEVKIRGIQEDLRAIMEDENGHLIEYDEETNMINSYNKLYEVNSDSVGWLSVKGTNIDYPVVKYEDNKYYLGKNIYREDDYNGWVFMDYRNSIENLDDNTIIYAHNRYTSGVMFGTLTNLRKKKWTNNKGNYFITFNTLYKEHRWKVFSYYGIDVTSDYLYTNFENDEEKQVFIDMITRRSEYNFDTEVTVNDKMLTLSTCLDNDQRFVVHAVLVD